MCVLVAPRRPEPFGHGINIKGRVNIVNNLRYNGPSGVDDKFVDMKPEERSRGERDTERDRETERKRERERERRETTATRAPIGCAPRRKIASKERVKQKNKDGTRKRRDFRRYHKPPFGGWNFPPGDSDTTGSAGS